MEQGALIKEFRHTWGLTQMAMAAMVGASTSMISMVESGQRLLPIEILSVFTELNKVFTEKMQEATKEAASLQDHIHEQDARFARRSIADLDYLGIKARQLEQRIEGMEKKYELASAAIRIIKLMPPQSSTDKAKKLAPIQMQESVLQSMMYKNNPAARLKLMIKKEMLTAKHAVIAKFKEQYPQ